MFVQLDRDSVAAKVFGAIEADGLCFGLVGKLDRISIAKRLSKWRNVEQRLCLAEGRAFWSLPKAMLLMPSAACGNIHNASHNVFCIHMS